MKKRILCAILTLIMVVSLVPAAALSASAASNAISENAINVLKKLVSYDNTAAVTGCDGTTFGYGTECTAKDKTKAHKHSEEEADAALRAELKELDTAVNNFASKKGLSLTQGQHDALVVFCHENGTVWLNGTGDLQTAIVNKLRGSEFLTAICLWHDSDDNDRRMIEANMYLNGAYSAEVPSRFIEVNYVLDGGVMNEETTQYYDTKANPTANLVPTKSGFIFMGWFDEDAAGTKVTALTKNRTVYAYWQAEGASYEDAVVVDNTMTTSTAIALYAAPGSTASNWSVKGKLGIDKEYVDKDGVKWAHVCKAEKLYQDGKKVEGGVSDWIKLGANNNATSSDKKENIDVTVTVTNSYLRVRAEASIYSKELGQVHQGDQLRIVNTSNGKDGFLWGQIEEDKGWIALMYTNYNSVKEQETVNTSNAIATAVVNVNGYVNVRSDAGTANQIVGALANGMQVDLYETKLVNGILWGRCKSGWFCLSYAKVTTLVENNTVLGESNAAYAVTGDLIDATLVYKTAGSSEKVEKLDEKFTGKDVVVSNLVLLNGSIWGKISQGWVELDNLNMDVAKYTVAVSGLVSRKSPSAAAEEQDTLTKGLTLEITEITIVKDVFWGYDAAYGWINLSSGNVTRTNAPTIPSDNATTGQYTGTIATIVGADQVNVRVHGAIYADIAGKVAHGTVAPVLKEEKGWYEIDLDVDGDPKTGSWVYKDYVKISEGTINLGGTTNNGTTGTGTGSTTENVVGTGTGIIANTYSGVNIRTGVGTGYPAIGKILPGTTVEILEIRTHGATKWGRVDKGWICMDYVTMLTDFLPGVIPGTGTDSTTAVTAIYEGVISAPSVNIRKTTDKDADNIIRTVTQDTTVTVHEIITIVKSEVTATNPGEDGSSITTTTKTTHYWARVNDGYIYNPAAHISLNAMDEVTHTVLEDIKISDSVKLAKGDKVTVTTLTIDGGSVKGLVNGKYTVDMAKLAQGNVAVSKPADKDTTTTPSTPVVGAGSSVGGYTNTDGYRYTGKVIHTDALNVRSTPSTSATKTTTLASGDSLVIYETTTSENMAWGRCDAGWVYLYYVDLTPVVNGAVDARVVYNDNTIAYTDMNGTEAAGTYAKMAVIDIYEVVGKMARTELGWVHTDNLLN